MSEPPISASEVLRREMRAALASGWRRRDLWWERLSERANQALCDGREEQAARDFVRAHWLAVLSFAPSDPRRATAIANAGFAAQAEGQVDRARQRYRVAIDRWHAVPGLLPSLVIGPRARSSSFHLRMEARHRDTFRENAVLRLGRFVEETRVCLEALAVGRSPPHRLYSRWRGEKPAIFDDMRKVLSACLLLAGDPTEVPENRDSSQEELRL